MSERFNQDYAVVIGAETDLLVTIDDATAEWAYPPKQLRLLVNGEADRKSSIPAPASGELNATPLGGDNHE